MTCREERQHGYDRPEIEAIREHEGRTGGGEKPTAYRLTKRPTAPLRTAPLEQGEILSSAVEIEGLL
jgi:hypothetical protein